jgi:Flp pilus assembly protein TadD
MVFVITAVTLLLYVRCLSFDYIYCDDNLFILDNETYNRTIENIVGSFTSTLTQTSSYYRPVFSCSFIVEEQIGGTSPRLHHLTNLLFHLLGTLLLFATLLKLGYPKGLSLGATLVFAVHPLMVPATAWISGRNDTMVTTFLFVSFICFVNYLESPLPRKRRWLVLHGCALTAALFTKEIAVLFPVVLAAYAVLFRKERLGDKKYFAAFAVWGACILFWCLLRHFAVGETHSPDVVGIGPLLKNLPIVPAIVGKMFLPVKMTALANIDGISVFTGVAAAAMICAFTFMNKRADRRRILFGAVWFILLVAPTLMIRLKDDFFGYAEHRAYLLFFGVLVIVLELCLPLSFFKKRTAMWAVLALVGLFFLRSSAYATSLRDQKAFWTDRHRVYPFDRRTNMMLGEIFFTNGIYDSARSSYAAAMNVAGVSTPATPEKSMFVNLSAMARYEGRYDDAESFARRALAIDSSDADATYNLGKSLLLRGRNDESLPFLTRAAQNDCRDPVRFMDLGAALFNAGRLLPAADAFQKAIDLAPDLKGVWANLGSVYARTGRTDEAEKMFLAELQRDSSSRQAYINLITLCCTQLNDFRKASMYADQSAKRGIILPQNVKLLLGKTQRK